MFLMHIFFFLNIEFTHKIYVIRILLGIMLYVLLLSTRNYTQTGSYTVRLNVLFPSTDRWSYTLFGIETIYIGTRIARRKLIASNYTRYLHRVGLIVLLLTRATVLKKNVDTYILYIYLQFCFF